MPRPRIPVLGGRVAVAVLGSLGVHVLLVALLLGAAFLVHSRGSSRTIVVDLDAPGAPPIAGLAMTPPPTPPRRPIAARPHPVSRPAPARPSRSVPAPSAAPTVPPPAPRVTEAPGPDTPVAEPPVLAQASPPADEQPREAESTSTTTAEAATEPAAGETPVAEAPAPAAPLAEALGPEKPETAPAVASAPSERLGPELPPAEVRSIAKKASVSAHAAIEPFRVRRDVLEYLLDHPEFATYITRTLRVARYRVWQTIDGLHLDDGWGAKLRFSVAPASHGARLIRARGEYDPGLLPSVHGDVVVMVNPTFTRDGEGRDVVTLGVTALVKLDSSFARLVANVARSAVDKKAQLEAWRLGHVIARVSHAIEQDPAGLVQQLATRPGVPQQDLQEFAALLGVR